MEGVLYRAEGLFLEDACPTIPGQRRAVGDVDEGHGGATLHLSGIGGRLQIFKGPALIGLVAVNTRSASIGRESVIEEQHLAQVDLLRRHRVLDRDRYRGERADLRGGSDRGLRETGPPRQSYGQYGKYDGDHECKRCSVGTASHYLTSRRLRVPDR